jgi:multicomponent Na+:H+ antiporter subunit D
MKSVLVLPILIPAFTAAACLLASRSRAAQRAISITGSASLFAASIWLLREVYAQGILVVNSATGRRRSASRWWPIFSRP